MTYLFINTVNPNYASFAIFESEGAVLYSYKFIDKQELLNENLAAFLKNKKIKPQAINGLMVITGPGSFSASRAGVVLANAFNFLYGVPVLGVMDSGASAEEIIKDNFSRLKRAKKSLSAEVYYKNPAVKISPNIS